MNIIKNTNINRKRIKVMTKELFPQYKYIKVKSNGLVVFKEKWYRFTKQVVSITDLVLDAIPKEISKRLSGTNNTTNLLNLFADDIYLLLKLRDYRNEVDLVGKIWQVFNKYCLKAPLITTYANKPLAIESSKGWLPVISFYRRVNLPNLQHILDHSKGRSQRDTLISKLARILAKERFSNRYILPAYSIADIKLVTVG